MSGLVGGLYTAIVMIAATPTPQPNFNENSVTPTWVGFAATFGVAAIVVLLCIDMVRRVRRVRYRGEIREQLEAERDAAATDTPPTGP
jgi:Ni/Fe-hydrogenase subunit HybB-like protein